MKFKIILFAFSVFFANIFFAQLTADAGPTQVVCKNWTGFDTLLLGGNPSATNGAAPYSYSWSANYQLTIGSTTLNYSASDFLADTAVANPSLVQFPIEEELYFYLTVYDAAGNEAMDSTLIKPAIFYQHLGTYSYNLAIGDSLFFNSGPNITGGFEPYQNVIWRPNAGLVDSTLLNGFWIKPESNQTYYVTITDSAGCVVSGSPFVTINVGSASIGNFDQDDWLIYPNPSQSHFSVEHAENIKEIHIFDIQGKYIKTCASIPCSVSDITSGIFLILIYSSDGQFLVKKLEVE